MDHYPVLLKESIELLDVRPDRVYIEATCGLGNHTRAVAALLSSGRLYACDRDQESLAKAKIYCAEFANRIEFIHCKFSELQSALKERGVERVDGLLADLGVSRYQLTDAERGFSFQNDGPLDMRMSRLDGQTAADIVNFTAERQLADWIYQLGEERSSRQIAAAVLRARPIRSTLHLAGVIEKAVFRKGKLNPATKTFMALRQLVNEEPEELDALLAAAPALAASGGRIAIISFMSLEDRRVKRTFQALAHEGRAELLNKHVIVPSSEEVNLNSASRSGKLRGLLMLDQVKTRQNQWVR